MFLSLQKSIEITLIVLVTVQYALALFCLLKLAYFDVTKREYVLWNLFIMLVFFVGSAVFLIYYYMHPDKRIGKAPEAQRTSNAQDEPQKETEDKSADGEQPDADGKEVNAPSAPDGEKSDKESRAEVSEDQADTEKSDDTPADGGEATD